MFKLRAPDGTNNLCGKLIAHYRKQAKLSQRALAVKMQISGYDVDHHVIRRIELGERFVTDIELLAFCNVFNLSEQQLLGKMP